MDMKIVNKLAGAMAKSDCSACCMDVKSERSRIAKCAIEELSKILNEHLTKFEKKAFREHKAYMRDRSKDIDMDIDPVDDRESTLWEQGNRYGIEQTIEIINKLIK